MCPAGKFLTDTGTDESFHDSLADCTPCDPGTSSEEGSASCDACGPGKHAASSGSIECAPCGLGKFAEGRAGDSCSFCDEILFGSVTADEGSSSANMCICTAGFYAPAAEGEDVKCTICPAGSDCAESGATVATLPLEPGHWRSSSESTEILKCDDEEACTPTVCEDKTEQIKEQTGGAVEDCSYYEEYCEDDSALVNSASQSYPEGWVAFMCAKSCGLCGQLVCAEGHRGPMCELCEDGYAAMQGSCVECEGGGSAAALVGFVVVLLMTAGLVAWFVRRNGAKVKKWTHGSGMAAVKAVLA